VITCGMILKDWTNKIPWQEPAYFTLY